MRRPNFRAPLFCAPAPPGKNAQNCSINFLTKPPPGFRGRIARECAGHAELALQRRQRQLMRRMWRMRRMRLKISGGPVRYFQLIIQAKRAECETNSGARRLRTKSAKRRSGNPDFKRRGNFFFAALKAARNGKKRNPRGVSHQARRKPIPPRGMRNAEFGRRKAEGGRRSAKPEAFSCKSRPRLPCAKWLRAATIPPLRSTPNASPMQKMIRDKKY